MYIYKHAHIYAHRQYNSLAARKLNSSSLNNKNIKASGGISRRVQTGFTYPLCRSGTQVFVATNVRFPELFSLWKRNYNLKVNFYMYDKYFTCSDKEEHWQISC